MHFRLYYGNVMNIILYPIIYINTHLWFSRSDRQKSDEIYIIFFLIFVIYSTCYFNFIHAYIHILIH